MKLDSKACKTGVQSPTCLARTNSSRLRFSSARKALPSLRRYAQGGHIPATCQMTFHLSLGSIGKGFEVLSRHTTGRSAADRLPARLPYWRRSGRRAEPDLVVKASACERRENPERRAWNLVDATAAAAHERLLFTQSPEHGPAVIGVGLQGRSVDAEELRGLLFDKYAEGTHFHGHGPVVRWPGSRAG